jgi:SAM-dependent methyltransferase
MPSSAWQTTSAQWLEFIDADASVDHPVWVSCDEFDEDLRTMLERFPFLGGLDTTSVSIVPGPLPSERPPDAGFDSMTTLIRPSPLEGDGDGEADEDDEATLESSVEAAQTMVRGRIEDAESDAAFEVGIAAPEAGLEVSLEAPQGGDDEGLFIPNLTRTIPEPPARTGDTLPPVGEKVAPGVTDRYPTTSSGTVVRPSPMRATDGGTMIAADAPTAADVIAYARQHGYVPQDGGHPPQPYVPSEPPPPPPPYGADAGQAGRRPTPAYDPSPAPTARSETVIAPHRDNSGPIYAEPYEPVPAANEEEEPASSGPPPPPPFGQTARDRTPPESTMDTPPAIDLASARAQAYDDDEADGEDIAHDRLAASSQTAGVIVTGFDAADSLSDGALREVLDEEDSPVPKKIVVVDPASAGQPAAPEEELDTVDLIDADTPLPLPQPRAASEPTPAVPPEPPAPPQEVAQAQTPAPKGPPPAPKGPPPAPVKSVRKSDAPRLEAAPLLLPPPTDLTGVDVLERGGKEGAPASGWYDEAFGDHFASLARAGHPAEVKAEIEFFLQSSGLQPGSRVLDVASGDGAHAIVLAQRGYAATGFDASLPQLLRAQAANDALGAGVHFLLGDMRDPPVEGPFEGIICLGTSLGYFDDDVNRRTIRKLRDRLALGGRMMLQVFNRDHVVARLPARSWWQGHGCLVLDEAEMNYFTSRLQVHRTIVFEDGRQFEHDISVRAYTAHDLVSLCLDAGLRVLEISGSRLTRGRFYGATSPEIWLLVERP